MSEDEQNCPRLGKLKKSVVDQSPSSFGARKTRTKKEYRAKSVLSKAITPCRWAVKHLSSLSSSFGVLAIPFTTYVATTVIAWIILKDERGC